VTWRDALTNCDARRAATQAYDCIDRARNVSDEADKDRLLWARAGGTEAADRGGAMSNMPEPASRA
jgi:hypothetical protein